MKLVAQQQIRSRVVRNIHLLSKRRSSVPNRLQCLLKRNQEAISTTERKARSRQLAKKRVRSVESETRQQAQMA